MTSTSLATKTIPSLDYSIASNLANGLVANHDFADHHSLVSVKSAVKLIHDAGLSTVFIPYADRKRTSKAVKWEMMLCVVDRGACDQSGRWHCNADEASFDNPATRVYSMTRCLPMNHYVGELFTCNLHELWYAANGFFSDISYMLLGTMLQLNTDIGRSHWGDRYRASFESHFQDIWHPDHRIHPAVKLSPDRLRFESAPLLPDWDLLFSNK